MWLKKLSFKQLFSLVLCTALLLASFVFSDTVQAATIEETLTRTGQEFLNSVLEDYNKDTRDVFNKQFKEVKQTVGELSKQITEVADPALKPAQRDKLLKKIANNQAALKDAADSLNGLAQKTEQFDNGLEKSVASLLDTVQQQVRTNLTSNQNTFENLAKAVSDIANDTRSIDPQNLSNFASQIGGHLKNFDQTINSANGLLKAFAG